MEDIVELLSLVLLLAILSAPVIIALLLVRKREKNTKEALVNRAKRELFKEQMDRLKHEIKCGYVFPELAAERFEKIKKLLENDNKNNNDSISDNSLLDISKRTISD